MKTKQLFFSGVFLVAFGLNVNAQTTQATNAITSTSYVGTSNNFDVVFKRQAVDAGLLSTIKTSFGVNSFATSYSVAIGAGAGQFSSGNSNFFLGYSSGASSIGGSNTFLGSFTGFNSQGSRNILIGSGVGEDLIGSNNIIIGNNEYLGFNINNKLFIDTFDEGQNPLIWGDFALDQLKFNAKVGIGYNFGNYPTTAGSVDVSPYNLFVKGGILTEEVRVMLQANWADYVFAKDYKLPTLPEVEEFIAKNGHLPNVPSAQQIKEDGIELGEMAKIQQEKIEELTLYVLQLNKENEKQAKENAALSERLLKLENLVNTLVK